MTAPSRDEFEIWAADPVTVFVLNGLTTLAAKQADAFKEAAWAGPTDWDALRLFRERASARADAYSDLANITIEDAYGANGLEAPAKESE